MARGQAGPSRPASTSKSAEREWLISLLVEARADDSTMASTLTSATPMISAAAVVVVRRALAHGVQAAEATGQAGQVLVGPANTETSGGISRGLKRAQAADAEDHARGADQPESQSRLPWSMNRPTPTKANPRPRQHQTGEPPSGGGFGHLGHRHLGGGR